MSKRHKKTKMIFSTLSEGRLDVSHYGSDDAFLAPKGRKPKGKERRNSAKPAYYD